MKKIIVLAVLSCLLLSACGTVAFTKDTEMPSFSVSSNAEAQGGSDIMVCYIQPCIEKLDSIPNDFHNKFITPEEFNEWFEKKNNYNEIQTDIDNYSNMFSFITDFDISEQEVREYLAAENEYYNSHADLYSPLEKYIYTDAEIDTLSTRNKEECQRLFCSDYSIAIGDKIYPMRFWYEYSIDSYKALGVDANVLLQHGRLYEQLLGESKQSIALSNKIMEYAINQAESEKLTGELATLEYSNVEIPDSVKGFFSDDLQEKDTTDKELRK